MTHPPEVKKDSKASIWRSRPGYKPAILLFAAIVLATLVIIPPPQSMIDLVSKANLPGYKLAPGD